MNPLRKRIHKSCQELLYLSDDLLTIVNRKDVHSHLSKMRYTQEIIKRGLADVQNTTDNALRIITAHQHK